MDSVTCLKFNTDSVCIQKKMKMKITWSFGKGKIGV